MQPIRELTKNWEVDVASELNDYLEEVRQAPASSGLIGQKDPWTNVSGRRLLLAGQHEHHAGRRGNPTELRRGGAADPGLGPHLQQEGWLTPERRRGFVLASF